MTDPIIPSKRQLEFLKDPQSLFRSVELIKTAGVGAILTESALTGVLPPVSVGPAFGLYFSVVGATFLYRMGRRKGYFMEPKPLIGEEVALAKEDLNHPLHIYSPKRAVHEGISAFFCTLGVGYMNHNYSTETALSALAGCALYDLSRLIFRAGRAEGYLLAQTQPVLVKAHPKKTPKP